MNDLISIIVPVYNSSDYIDICVQSVLQQSYSNFELILINDGSQDNSKKICKELSNLDERIRFFTQKHKGVSAARNMGLKIAKGNYLFFLDSDDVIHPHLLKSLYMLLVKTQAKIAAEEYCYINTDHSYKFSEKGSFNEYIYLDNQTTLDIFTRGFFNTLYGVGGLMIRRNISHSLFFDEKMTNGEDTKFIYQLLLRGSDIVFLHQRWYYYRKYENNSSKIRTVASCQSMYRCESYIRDHELINNRIINAITKEEIILRRICEWYSVGKKLHNKRLCCYLNKLAEREKKLSVFTKTNLYMRNNFFLAFRCFPIYYTLHNLLALYHKLINFRKHKS